MPPRPTQEGGPARGGRGRGAGRGRGGDGPPRAGPPGNTGRGAQRAGANVQPSGSPAAHLTTVGVKRPNYGSKGISLSVQTNAWEVSLPEGMIYHYDEIEKTLPPRVNMVLLKQLQLEPEFHPVGAYDGKKNLFMPHLIDFGDGNVDSRKYHVSMNGNHQPTGRPPPIYAITVKKVAEINPEVLQRFINGQQSQDEAVLTALTALNVVIRMLPLQTHPFNTRSFFTDAEKKDVGQGFQLWRGYFQSLRPALGRLLVNIDLSTGMFYKPGPLINIALEASGLRDPRDLTATAFDHRRLRELERFLSGVRVSVQPAGGGPPNIVVIHSLTREGATNIRFEREGRQTNVAAYYRELTNRALQFPNMICAKTAKGAVLPFERCTIIPGQIARKQVPPDVTRHMVEFSTKKPGERLNSIKNAFPVLAYGQSEYVRNFGLTINQQAPPMEIPARQLPAPKLLYGQKKVVVPRGGSWNMASNKLHTPTTLDKWIVMSFEGQRRFNNEAAMRVVTDFVTGCISVGINVINREPPLHWGAAQNVIGSLRDAGKEYHNRTKSLPEFILIILPDIGNTEIYRQVKYFGDISTGAVTQCLKVSKCTRAKPQYWANVCLKVNPKLGGVNVIPDLASASFLGDSQNPTIVIGADVMHPAPGSETPSYASVVGSVDSSAARYVSRMAVQQSRQEIIADLEGMVTAILTDYMDYQKNAEKKSPANCKPKRILFFRDGVSEGQFAQVKDLEVDILKKACAKLGIPAKITFLVVGKRHHYRFFPKNPDNMNEADRNSGNCIAGTVVDKGITHPLEFDWYLQSHGGLLGTSRSAHYSVLHDDNAFTADALQEFCNLLCYIYARSTRSVSIPAPVYYADIVCSRAKNHYAPISDRASTVASEDLQSSIADFKPLNAKHLRKMYFM